jgi:hypothetical protein
MFMVLRPPNADSNGSYCHKISPDLVSPAIALLPILSSDAYKPEKSKGFCPKRII